ncbi:MAG: MFS transporter [Anaerolineae bacterium]
MTTLDNRSRNRLLLVLFVGVLMGALDIAIVGPALPAIQTEFGVDDRALAWVFTVYVLANLVGTPLMAKLSDRAGRRSIYVLDVILFAAGSLVVALSPTFAVLLLGRAIQGLGAGGIFPVASAVIGDTFPVEKRGSALGLIGAVFGIAFLVGPILGGVILLALNWHWLFLINLPIAAVLIVAALRLLPTTRPQQHLPFDWAGMIVLTALLTAMTYGMNQLDTANLPRQPGHAAGLGFPAAGYRPCAGLRVDRKAGQGSGTAPQPVHQTADDAGQPLCRAVRLRRGRDRLRAGAAGGSLCRGRVRRPALCSCRWCW